MTVISRVLKQTMNRGGEVLKCLAPVIIIVLIIGWLGIYALSILQIPEWDKGTFLLSWKDSCGFLPDFSGGKFTAKRIASQAHLLQVRLAVTSIPVFISWNRHQQSPFLVKPC